MNKQEKLKNLGVKFILKNSRDLLIEFPSNNFEVKYVDNRKSKIKNIKYNDIEINIGDVFKEVNGLGNSIKYYANIILPTIENKSFEIKDADINKATLFALPFAFNCLTDCSFVRKIDKYYYGYLINAYLSTNIAKNSNKHSIFLLLKYSKSDIFKNNEENLFQHRNFIKAIDFDKNYVLYEFNIDKQFHNDLDLLYDGKYSKVSEDAKRRYANFYKKQIEGNYVLAIVNRARELTEAIENDLDVKMNDYELCSRFGSNEILDINNFSKNE